MKSKLFFTAIFTLCLFVNFDASAQEFPGLDKSPMDGASYPSSYKISDKVVKITYGRPQLKGRAVSELAPAGKVWRTGANEAPEITFYKDVNFGGKDVKAGTYTLFTIPNEGEWTVILSTASNVWGAYFYKENEDVVRVTAKVSNSAESIEAFSIMFDGEGSDFQMHFGFGNVVASLPVKG
ncbi:MAG: asparagine synthetase B [Bacteroidetes bacterium MedPE-SWsnd-G1]|nr:MAG: asparagine synthetase B [Bacteroidetes bacterium MedPE-SWsnd-G1]